MAYIHARSGKNGTTFRAEIRMRGYPPQSATFERKTDAKRWASQTETAIREGRYFKSVEASKHTVSELIDRYKRDVMPHKGPWATHQADHLAWWKAHLGDYRLSDVSPVLLSEHRDKLLATPTRQGTPRSKATVNRYLASLSHVFTTAVREFGWLDANPMQKVRRLPEPRGRVRFLSDDERERLLEACTKSRNAALYPVVILALASGARRGELLSLRWQDVDLKAGRLTIQHSKNGERRGLPLSGFALQIIRGHATVRRIDSDLVFPSATNPKRPTAIRESFETACRAAGIEDFRFHDLRHSAASYLAMNGASTREIAEVLGHRTLQMAQRYSHLSEQHTAGVLASMNNAIFTWKT